MSISIELGGKRPVGSQPWQAPLTWATSVAGSRLDRQAYRGSHRRQAGAQPRNRRRQRRGKRGLGFPPGRSSAVQISPRNLNSYSYSACCRFNTHFPSDGHYARHLSPERVQPLGGGMNAVVGDAQRAKQALVLTGICLVGEACRTCRSADAGLPAEAPQLIA
jgi:hypothetical protein